jgi:hypothetical protein
MRAKVPEDSRYEIKFVGRPSEHHRLRGWLHNSDVGFRSPYPDRVVNNIYFDGHDYRSYGENLSGASERVKLRYRWYGESETPERGQLELKCKRNFYGWKMRFPVAGAPYASGDTWRRLRGRMMEQLTPEGRFWLTAHPFAVLLNRYRRQYYVSADGRVRATIDTGLRVCDQRFKPVPNFARRANIAPSIVVEFKFARVDRLFASDILQGIPLRVSRHSKYMVGVSSIAHASV